MAAELSLCPVCGSVITTPTHEEPWCKTTLEIREEIASGKVKLSVFPEEFLPFLEKAGIEVYEARNKQLLAPRWAVQILIRYNLAGHRVWLLREVAKNPEVRIKLSDMRNHDLISEYLGWIVTSYLRRGEAERAEAKRKS